MSLSTKANSLIVGFTLAATMMLTSACAHKAPPAPSGPLGSQANPISLDKDPTAQTVNASELVRNIYINSNNLKSVDVPLDRLVLIGNLYDQKYVAVQSGDNLREFLVQAKCVDSDRVIALEIDENTNPPAGNAGPKGRGFSPSQIYAAPHAPSSTGTASVDNNPCALALK